MKDYNLMYDVVIIGGGPCGLATGLALQEKGIQYVIIEKEAIVNSIVNCPLDMRFYSTSDRLEIGNIPFLSQEAGPSRTELLKYYRLVTERQAINIKCYQKVEHISQNNDSFTVHAMDRNGLNINYEAKMIVIATGNFDHPKHMGIKGEDTPKVMHYYKEGHPYYDQHVTVIGGKNSAIEAAIDLYRNGANVKNVFLAGVVTGGIMNKVYIEDGRFHGVKIAEELEQRLI